MGTSHACTLISEVNKKKGSIIETSKLDDGPETEEDARGCLDVASERGAARPEQAEKRMTPMSIGGEHRGWTRTRLRIKHSDAESVRSVSQCRRVFLVLTVPCDVLHRFPLK